MTNNLAINIAPRTIFTGDNLPILRGINSESVDLIYLDPPFNSNANYAAPIGSEAADAEFKDTWTLSDIDKAWHGELADVNQGLHDFLISVSEVHSKSMFSYLIYMAIRLLEMQRVLKPTGSIYLHCDSTASSYLRVMMDAIFDRKNFCNEISWCYSTSGRAARGNRKTWAKKHDIILFYAKDAKQHVSDCTVACSEKYIESHYKHVDKDGIKYRIRVDHGKERIYSSDEGINGNDWWDDVPYVNSQAKERTGYPTQKPLALLERIIKASSNGGEIILDPFCGCATACVAAEKLGREWIGIDISVVAANLVKSRAKVELRDLFNHKRVFNPIHREDIPKRTDMGKIPKYNIKANKNFLYGEQEGVCNGCKIHFRYRNFAVDHIIPKAKGGNDHIGNLQLLCSACNSTKGTGSQAELIAKLKEQNK